MCIRDRNKDAAKPKPRVKSKNADVIRVEEDLKEVLGTKVNLNPVSYTHLSEKWGVDVEEAVKLALMDLKCSRDEVEVTVLEQPSKGFFGIGSKLAKVRVEKKKTEEKEAADDIYDEAAINACLLYTSIS